MKSGANIGAEDNEIRGHKVLALNPTLYSKKSFLEVTYFFHSSLQLRYAVLREEVALGCGLMGHITRIFRLIWWWDRNSMFFHSVFFWLLFCLSVSIWSRVIAPSRVSGARFPGFKFQLCHLLTL